MALVCLSSKALVASTQALGRTSNGTQQKVAMKSRSTYQVQIVVGDDEPQDNAMKRFRREVMTAGKLPSSQQTRSKRLPAPLVPRRVTARG